MQVIRHSVLPAAAENVAEAARRRFSIVGGLEANVGRAPYNISALDLYIFGRPTESPVDVCDNRLHALARGN